MGEVFCARLTDRGPSSEDRANEGLGKLWVLVSFVCGADGVQCPFMACEVPFSRKFIEGSVLSLVYVLGSFAIN